jgi:ribonuclease HI
MQFEDRERTLDAFTDGSCINNGGKRPFGGIGVAYAPPSWPGLADVSLPASATGARRVTNQTMEVCAVTSCLRAIASLASPPGSARIHSDSEYAIKSLTQWMRGWIRNGWRTAFGKPVKNRDELEAAWAALQACAARGVLVTFHHVRAHGREPALADEDAHARWRGNRAADDLAFRAAMGHPRTADVVEALARGARA